MGKTAPMQLLSIVGDNGGRDILPGFRIALRRPVPETSPKRGHIDHVRGLGVRDHSVTPLEVKALDACPVFATILGAPDRRFKSARINEVRIPLIDRDVVNVLVFCQYGAPGLACIG